jgi:hypothetical protein
LLDLLSSVDYARFRGGLQIIPTRPKLDGISWDATISAVQYEGSAVHEGSSFIAGEEKDIRKGRGQTERVCLKSQPVFSSREIEIRRYLVDPVASVERPRSADAQSLIKTLAMEGKRGAGWAGEAPMIARSAAETNDVE